MNTVYVILNFTNTCSGHGESYPMVDDIVGRGFFTTRAAAEKYLGDMEFKQGKVIKELTLLE